MMVILQSARSFHALSVTTTSNALRGNNGVCKHEGALRRIG
jgi:hypothetical protein